jgi:predicted dinucleotide-binding enzyme
MRIAILGTGNVASALAGAWTRKGHEVTFGTRHASGEGSDGLRRLPHREACAGAEVVVLATPWHATPDLLATLGDALDGTIVVDCTNPLTASLSGLTLSGETSAGETVQSLLPRARVVKAFNTTGAANMAEASAHYLERAPAMFYCGDDEDAKRIVRGLVEDVAFEPVDAGSLDASRLLEPLALLWIRLAYTMDRGTGFAFTLVDRH